MGRPGLSRHPKFISLTAAIGDRARARGSLELVWEVAYESGDAVIGGPDEIEAAAYWRGRKGVLFAAMRDAGLSTGRVGFIEPDPDKLGVWQVHDLWDHAPDYVRKRWKREQERRGKGSATEAERRAVTGQRPPDGADQPSVSSTPTPSPAPTPSPDQDQEDLLGGADLDASDPGRLLQRLWNEVMPRPPFQRWVHVTEDRKTHARARWEEQPSEGYWRGVLTRLADSPWCRGEVAGRDSKFWLADPDFLLRPATHKKAMEGKYDRRDRTPPSLPPRAATPGVRVVQADEDLYRQGNG